MVGRRRHPDSKTRTGCLVFWSCFIIFFPIIILYLLLELLVNLILEKRHEYRKWSERRRGRNNLQNSDEAFITGRLTESELTAATQTTTPLSPPAEHGKIVPFLPLEVVREIIRHATDTFPEPSSIHYPSPSNSQPFSPLALHPQFPNLGRSFREEIRVARDLHAQSMKLKLCVTGVSRTWQNLAVEFLFNSIRIHDMKQIPLLWRAFEGDAKRRGERASKEIIARPGSAPWWIRELWVDHREIDLNDLPDSTEFQLADLLKICPNLTKYRGLGSWRQSHFPSRWRDDAVLQQLLRLPDDPGDKAHAELHGVRGNEAHGYAHELQSSDFDVPDTGRRIELCFAFDGEQRLEPCSDPPIPRPRTLTLPCISSLELRSLSLFMAGNPVTYNTIRLPNLVHLSLGGTDSFLCATTRLILPSLRSVTLGPGSMSPLGESHLESFLEKHGFALEDLTILETSYSKSLQRLDQLCPVLQTFRTHYSEIPRSTVSSVRNVGIYGLEHAGPYSQSGESMIFGILKAFPSVITIQDLSWRSSAIRRRAYITRTYPEGAKRRKFWDQALCAVRGGAEPSQPLRSDERFPVRGVALLDWRGKAVEAVPTMPPGGQDTIVGPDDQLLDALLEKWR